MPDGFFVFPPCVPDGLRREGFFCPLRVFCSGVFPCARMLRGAVLYSFLTHAFMRYRTPFCGFWVWDGEVVCPFFNPLSKAPKYKNPKTAVSAISGCRYKHAGKPVFRRFGLRRPDGLRYGPCPPDLKGEAVWDACLPGRPVRPGMRTSGACPCYGAVSLSLWPYRYSMGTSSLGR